MKVITILGTRPEIIRLSLIIRRLDGLCDHVLVHTGQNYDVNLSEIFFRQLGVRQPDYAFGAKGSFGVQVGRIFACAEEVFLKEKPDAVLILGDTNSGLSAIVAKRLGVPVFHMEAGNRCFDDRVPEEVNRRLIDHASTILLPYTRGSRENLLREGVAINSIYVTGNPIWEVIQHHHDAIGKSDVLQRLHLSERRYLLVTAHRAENVDDEVRLRALVEGLERLHVKYGFPVICSLHPRTHQKLRTFGVGIGTTAISFVEPLGFFDFIALEQQAFCVLSDSGTVQEECCILHTPNVTLRDVTERPETLECGSNVLSGTDPEKMERCVELATSVLPNWSAPGEYLQENVSQTVVNILLGYNKRVFDQPRSPEMRPPR
ncbi:MAG: non-hydrolyzing UDP-N-acetylglucosamine 2-epimerase [Nitrospirota bacterium]